MRAQSFAQSPAPVKLAWTHSTDNVAVIGYNIYRDGKKIGSSPTTAYTDATVAPTTQYSYTVSAFDAAGNESDTSLPYVIKTGTIIILPPTTIQIPGPSFALWNAPYYTCVRNFYVATAIGSPAGSDSRTFAQAQSPSTPWLTLGKYDSIVGANGGSVGGDCINVQPGVYASGINALNGGSSATSTGYVVYRCTTLDACKITDSGQGLGTNNYPSAGGSYLIFDGFELASSNSGIQNGVGMAGGASQAASSTLCCHHLWFINNIVHGYGQAGYQGGLSDFVYVIHNTIFNNATGSNCGAIGSGISQYQPRALGAYTLLADDKSNAVTGNLASQGSWFRQVYSWNIIYNNFANCTSDGNGIIMDDWANSQGTITHTVYAFQGLISFNVVYNNGGYGIHIFSQDNGGAGTAGVGVTVANNSSFNNMLDTGNSATFRYEIGENGGSNNTFVNNVAYAITGSGVLVNNVNYFGNSNGGAASHFQNNVGFCSGASCSNPTTR